jgi:hypothetical protein
MTDAELQYLSENPNFWRISAHRNPPSSDASEEKFEDSTASPLSDTSYPPDNDLRRDGPEGATTPGASLGPVPPHKIEKLKMKETSLETGPARPTLDYIHIPRPSPTLENTHAYLTGPPPESQNFHLESSRPSHPSALFSAESHEGWEKNLSVVLRLWQTVDCKKYTGSATSDARIWLSDVELALELIHTHPLTWHLVACTMLRDCALGELKKAKAENVILSNWPAFKAWITGENCTR